MCRIVEVAVGTSVSFCSYTCLPQSPAGSELQLSSHQTPLQSAIAEGLHQIGEELEALQECLRSPYAHRQHMSWPKGNLQLVKHMVADLIMPGSSVIVAQGGQGGRGNVASGSRHSRHVSCLQEHNLML
jgi:GTPase involved in cell partitioning and DNA repair